METAPGYQQRHAQGLFDQARTAQAVVVRRYREQPSALVRDAMRHYRTGRFDKVMDGDFDLFG